MKKMLSYWRIIWINWQIKVMKPKLEVKYQPEILRCTQKWQINQPINAFPQDTWLHSTAQQQYKFNQKKDRKIPEAQGSGKHLQIISLPCPRFWRSYWKYILQPFLLEMGKKPCCDGWCEGVGLLERLKTIFFDFRYLKFTHFFFS